MGRGEVLLVVVVACCVVVAAPRGAEARTQSAGLRSNALSPPRFISSRAGRKANDSSEETNPNDLPDDPLLAPLTSLLKTMNETRESVVLAQHAAHVVYKNESHAFTGMLKRLVANMTELQRQVASAKRMNEERAEKMANNTRKMDELTKRVMEMRRNAEGVRLRIKLLQQARKASELEHRKRVAEANQTLLAINTMEQYIGNMDSLTTKNWDNDTDDGASDDEESSASLLEEDDSEEQSPDQAEQVLVQLLELLMLKISQLESFLKELKADEIERAKMYNSTLAAMRKTEHYYIGPSEKLLEENATLAEENALLENEIRESVASVALLRPDILRFRKELVTLVQLAQLSRVTFRNVSVARREALKTVLEIEDAVRQELKPKEKPAPKIVVEPRIEPKKPAKVQAPPEIKPEPEEPVDEEPDAPPPAKNMDSDEQDRIYG